MSGGRRKRNGGGEEGKTVHVRKESETGKMGNGMVDGMQEGGRGAEKEQEGMNKRKGVGKEQSEKGWEWKGKYKGKVCGSK